MSKIGFAQGLNLFDQLIDLLGLARIHARRWFIQEQKVRISGQGPGDLQTPLLTKGNRRGRKVTPMAETDKLQGLFGPLADGALLLQGSEPEKHAQQPRMRAAMAPDHDVLQHGHLREETNVLEGTADPQDGTLMRFDTIERLTFEHNRALILAIDAGHAVKQRRLPSPIRSDNRMNRARLDAHIHPVDRHQAAKAFRHLFCLKECHASSHPSPQDVPTGALERSRAPLRLPQF